MQVALVGRTEVLVEAGNALLERGHRISLVATRKEEGYYRATQEDFRHLAARAGAAFLGDADLGLAGASQLLRDLGCEVALSVHWPTRVSTGVLAIPRHGFLNLHFSDLPRYRGNAGPSWSILTGDAHQGITLHRMVAELDAGPVLSSARMPLDPDTSVSDLFDWWRAIAPRMLVDAVDALARGSATFSPQSADPGAIVRSYPLRVTDAHIDWKQPVEAVHRLVRAFTRPFPGAFTSLEGQRRVTVWRSARTGPGSFLAVPGQVLVASAGEPVIACADGGLELVELELEGCADPAEAKRAILRSRRHRLI